MLKIRNYYLELFLLGSFFVTFLSLHMIRQGDASLNGDLLENLAWGVGWQAGYFQHPPFFAWVTAIWFELFPRTHWAYFLLASTNSCLALVLVYVIAKIYLTDAWALLATAVLMITPFYLFQAYKYNANIALLAIWPFVFYRYLVFLERRNYSSAIYLGVAAAIAMLTKYYSIFLLASLLGHSITDSAVRSISEKSLYVMITVFLLAIGAHFHWLIETDFAVFSFVSERIDIGRDNIDLFSRNLLLFALYPVVVILGPWLLIYICYKSNLFGQSTVSILTRLKLITQFEHCRALLWVCIGPFALTLLYVLSTQIIAHTTWLIPVGFSWGVVLILLLGSRPLGLSVPYVATMFTIIFALILVGSTMIEKREQLPIQQALQIGQAV
ncbi:MAG: 4-amino-4-deoxy-L-arabinose transferase-like glycosyltransferase [Parasphingorhabdus sp.]|jgi:4-amino-4-deoxy-L-arabinose transferase-like glycosyltransferase